MDVLTAPPRAPGPAALVWLRALRLKFYPMSWLTYALGALAAVGPAAFAGGVFWAGFAFMVFLEAATVLSNEYFDFGTDSRNRLAGPFSGGSRVLVDGELSFAQLRLGIVVCLALTLCAALAVVVLAESPLVASVLMVVLVVLATGYTVPPLRLSYRTLGELDVAVTDSIGVLLCGWVLVGGEWRASLPWLLSLPLGLAFIPSITLCGVPDASADHAAGKRTIAVRLGVRGAALVAGTSAVLAAVAALVLPSLGLMPPLYGPLAWVALAHALLLAALLGRAFRHDDGARRIDGLIAVSLAFVLWFGVLPFYYLW